MRRITFTILLSTIILGVFLITSEVFAQNDPYGLKTTAGAAGLQNDTPVTVLLGNVIGTALSLISVIFFALMIYGGFRWMLSRGNADEATKALDTIIAAIIGIIIVLASYAITNFVFSSLGTGGGGAGATNESVGGGAPLEFEVETSSLGQSSLVCLRKAKVGEGTGFMCSKKSDVDVSECLKEFDSNTSCQEVANAIFNSPKQKAGNGGCIDSVAACIKSGNDTSGCISSECTACASNSGTQCILKTIGHACELKDEFGATKNGTCKVSPQPDNMFCSCTL